MLLLGFAKLDFPPEGDLLPLVARKFEADIAGYQHQAVANIFYSLARLQQYIPSVCKAVQQHVREHVYDFTPQVGYRSTLSKPFGGMWQASHHSSLGMDVYTYLYITTLDADEGSAAVLLTRLNVACRS